MDDDLHENKCGQFSKILYGLLKIREVNNEIHKILVPNCQQIVNIVIKKGLYYIMLMDVQYSD